MHLSYMHALLKGDNKNLDGSVLGFYFRKNHKVSTIGLRPFKRVAVKRV